MDLASRLRERVRGQVRFDSVTRALYATDASMYRIVPLGVVVPTCLEDVSATVAICRETGTPILPRGAGTSLAGQAVGAAVIIDFSRNLNRLISVDPDRRTARIQPGIVLDDLNAQLAPTGLYFAPDVAPSNRATVGGMINNNSCGAHSILYGKTVDHVLELEVLLSDGTRARLGPSAHPDAPPRIGELTRAVSRLVQTHRDEIDRRFPKILRRVGGYNLDAFPAGEPVDPTKLIVGSEGTLAVVLEATVRLVPRPRHRALMTIEFAGLQESLEAVTALLQTRPAAVEVVDKMILDLACRQPEMKRRRASFLADPARSPEAQLLVEYFCDSADEGRARLDELDGIIRRNRLGYFHRPLWTKTEQEDAWAVRRAGVGILQGMLGDRKPQTFVEDCAVAPGRLAEFTRRFYEIVRRHGTTTAAYAHASAGILHFRPVLSVKDPADRRTMRAVAAETVELALEFGGAMSGEHGDGLARSCWNRRIFGDRIYEVFRQIKKLFDPDGLMNPGKIVDAPDMLEHLRCGADYRTAPWPTVMDFSREGGFAGHVELCNGNGACRKAAGLMCPSFMASRDEAHSTRGRANILREVISGGLPSEEAFGKPVYDVLDLCIECKGCKAECPSNVDLGRLKSEYLHRYRARHGTPIRSRLFANIAAVNRMGCALAPLSNLLVHWGPIRRLNQVLFGLSPRRTPPPFAGQTLQQWFAGCRGRPVAAGRPREGVFLFPDCFTNFNQPEVGRAAVAVLERVLAAATGLRVGLAPALCCGRPMIGKGMLDPARRQARRLVRELGPRVSPECPLVVLEPGCLSVFRDELVALVPTDAAGALAASTLSLEEFVLRRAADPAGLWNRSTAPGPSILVHGHCHQKALGILNATLELLRTLPGASVSLIDSSCCGMAGSFGYEDEHDEFSMKMAELRLLPAVRAAPAETVLVAPGISCRQQIAHGAGRSALHPAQVLAERLRR